MNKKLLVSIIIIIVLALVGLGVFAYLNNAETPENNITNNETEKTTGEGGEGYVPPTDDEVIKELFRIFNNKYPDSYDFKISKSESKKFTLTDLENSGVDVTYFNSEKVECSKDTTYIEVKYLDDIVIRQVHLDCIIK